MLDRKSHPEQAYRACLRLLILSRTYDRQRLNAANIRLNHFKCEHRDGARRPCFFFNKLAISPVIRAGTYLGAYLGAYLLFNYSPVYSGVTPKRPASPRNPCGCVPRCVPRYAPRCIPIKRAKKQGFRHHSFKSAIARQIVDRARVFTGLQPIITSNIPPNLYSEAYTPRNAFQIPPETWGGVY